MAFNYHLKPPNQTTFSVVLLNHHPIGSMYGIYANIWGILMVNDTIYGIHGSYGIDDCNFPILQDGNHDFPGNGI